MPHQQEPTAVSEDNGNLILLALLAILVGAGAGLLGALFRAFAHSSRRTAQLVDCLGVQRQAWRLPVCRCCLYCGGCVCGVAGPAVRASCIGKRHTRRRSRPAGAPAATDQAIFLIPAKFVGGVLAIGSGLALGREGPSVQMGASVAHLLAKVFRCGWLDSRALVAAGAGAGLATAFNAPLAGAIFVLEELFRRFETRMAIAALGASASAISVSRIVLGDAPDFQVAPLAYAARETIPLYFLLGAAAGLLAVVYNRTLLAALAAADSLSRWPVELRAGLIGAAVGGMAWFAPDLVGGGDPITQYALNGAGSLALLPMLFVLRLGLGAVSYAAGTPGGLFAPMLVLGAQLGLFFALLSRLAFPDLDIQPAGFAVIGMAALFTGIVRTPLTGIVLVVEMTASVTMLLPMLGACFVAMLVPTLLHDPPIYDSLRERVLRRSSIPPSDVGNSAPGELA